MFHRTEGNYLATAKVCGVNVGNVWRMIRNGKEPVREDIRRRMFFKPRLTEEELKQRREQKARDKARVDQEIELYFNKVTGDKHEQ